MKVFLYIRVACADQLAAADQREELERYAKDKGYEAVSYTHLAGDLRGVAAFQRLAENTTDHISRLRVYGKFVPNGGMQDLSLIHI